MVKSLVCGLCFLLFASLALVEAKPNAFKPQPFDWPQWQGPDRTAVSKETGLLQSWPKAGPPLVWKATGLGIGYTTPSIAAGRVFGMGSRNNDEVVWALDETTGKELWSATINSKLAKVSSNGDGPRSSPTVDGDKVYAAGVAGDLVCLEAANGKEVWHKSFQKDFKCKMPKWGFAESPLIDGKNVICTPGGPDATIVALDKASGEEHWRTAVSDCGGAGYASLVGSEAGGHRQYITLLGKCIVGVSAKDGKLLWRYSKAINGVANISTPLVKDDLVFYSTSYGAGAVLLRLVRSSDGGIKPEEVYSLPGKEFQNHHGGMVLVGDYVYGGHGQKSGAPTCIALKTGKILWKEPDPRAGSAAVLYADGRLYLRYEKGTMVLVEASPVGYKEKGRFKIPDNSGAAGWPHPVIANGKLFLRDQEILLCYDVKQH
jgi:outer membrane protein assembly factor BamB